jgi:protein YIPF6
MATPAGQPTTGGGAPMMVKEAAPVWISAANSTSSSSAPPVDASLHEAALFAAYSTLDEPVIETIMRDVRAVGAKLRIVLLPMDRTITPLTYAAVSSADQQSPNGETGAPPPPPTSTVPAPPRPTNDNQQSDLELSENDRNVLQQLKDWDLWGPLILCLALAVILSIKAPTDQASLVFAAVFSSVWVGGTVVTINAQLLGGTISFFQSLCVIGYSIFPMVIVAYVIGCLKLFIDTWLWLDLIVIFIGFLWSSRVSAIFVSLYVKPERRFLALYPLFFFYTFMGWMILLF